MNMSIITDEHGEIYTDSIVISLTILHSDLTPSDLYVLYFSSKNPHVRSLLDSQQCTSTLRTKYDLPYLKGGDDDSFLLVYTHWSYDHITPESIKYKSLAYILSKVAPSERARYTILSMRHTNDPADIQVFYDNYDSCFDHRFKNIPICDLRSMLSVIREMDCDGYTYQMFLEICLFVGYSEGVNSMLEMSNIHPDVSGLIKHGSKWVLSGTSDGKYSVENVCVLTGNIEMLTPSIGFSPIYVLVMCNRLDWVKTYLSQYPTSAEEVADYTSPSQLEIAIHLISLNRENILNIMPNAKEEDSEAMDVLESLYPLSDKDIKTIMSKYRARTHGRKTYIYERYSDRVKPTLSNIPDNIGVIHLRLLFCDNDTPIVDVYNPNNINLTNIYRYRCVSKDQITPYTVDVTHGEYNWIQRCRMIQYCIDYRVEGDSVLEHPTGCTNGLLRRCSVLEYMLRCPDFHRKIHLFNVCKINTYKDLRLVFSAVSDDRKPDLIPCYASILNKDIVRQVIELCGEVPAILN